MVVLYSYIFQGFLVGKGLFYFILSTPAFLPCSISAQNPKLAEPDFWILKSFYVLLPISDDLDHLSFLSLCFFLSAGFWFELRASWLQSMSHTSSPFCCGYFGDEVSWTICLGWSWMMIFPLSAFQVARIIAVSHQRPATSTIFYSLTVQCFP
jgi:hypothetical protein